MSEENIDYGALANLYRKLLNISKDMGTLPKNGVNKFHGYNYVLESDAEDRFRELCVKHGVMIIPNCVGVHERNADKGVITTVHMKYVACDVDTGVTIDLGMIPGSGHDNLDKGVFKAITGSVKYMILKVFHVPSGDDPERDEQNVQPGPRRIEDPKKNYDPSTDERLATDPQRKRAYALAKKAGMIDGDIKVFFQDVTGKESSKEWTRADVNRVFEELEKGAA